MVKCRQPRVKNYNDMNMMKRIFILGIALVIINIGFGQDVKRIKITELETIIAESKDPLVINFWATFCKPCMEEIPYFQKLEKKYKKEGMRLLLVSLDLQDDYPAKVNAFIRKKNITTPTNWLDETNADYFCPRIDEAWSGAIPATLFINNRNKYRKFIEDSLSEERLEKEIIAVLGKTD